MPEERTCDYSGEPIEPGTGIMYVRANGEILHFVDSKAEKNYLLGREPRDLEWTEAGGAREPEQRVEEEPAAEPEEVEEEAAVEAEEEPAAGTEDAEEEPAMEAEEVGEEPTAETEEDADEVESDDQESGDESEREEADPVNADDS